MEETRQERRHERRTKKKATIPQHGKSLARIYRNAISKRAKGGETHKK